MENVLIHISFSRNFRNSGLVQQFNGKIQRSESERERERQTGSKRCTAREREGGRGRETEGWMCLKSQSSKVYSLLDDVKAINTELRC